MGLRVEIGLVVVRRNNAGTMDRGSAHNQDRDVWNDAAAVKSRTKSQAVPPCSVSAEFQPQASATFTTTSTLDRSRSSLLFHNDITFVETTSLTPMSQCRDGHGTLQQLADRDRLTALANTTQPYHLVRVCPAFSSFSCGE